MALDIDVRLFSSRPSSNLNLRESPQATKIVMSPGETITTDGGYMRWETLSVFDVRMLSWKFWFEWNETIKVSNFIIRLLFILWWVTRIMQLKAYSSYLGL